MALPGGQWRSGFPIARTEYTLDKGQIHLWWSVPQNSVSSQKCLFTPTVMESVVVAIGRERRTDLTPTAAATAPRRAGFAARACTSSCTSYTATKGIDSMFYGHRPEAEKFDFFGKEVSRRGIEPTARPIRSPQSVYSPAVVSVYLSAEDTHRIGLFGTVERTVRETDATRADGSYC
jgi:hypothetical protein